MFREEGLDKQLGTVRERNCRREEGREGGSRRKKSRFTTTISNGTVHRISLARIPRRAIKDEQGYVDGCKIDTCRSCVASYEQVGQLVKSKRNLRFFPSGCSRVRNGPSGRLSILSRSINFHSYFFPSRLSSTRII